MTTASRMELSVHTPVAPRNSSRCLACCVTGRRGISWTSYPQKRHIRSRRAKLAQASERFQLPFVRRTVVPKDIEIAVVRADFEEDLTWPVPLVENFFDDEFALPHLKFHWPLVRFSTGVALYPQHHRRKFLLQRPILTVARIHRVAMKRPFN